MDLDVVAAAAAKSLQSCPTLCYPIDSSPPGSPVPGILQAWLLSHRSVLWWHPRGAKHFILSSQSTTTQITISEELI